MCGRAGKYFSAQHELVHQVEQDLLWTMRAQENQFVLMPVSNTDWITFPV
jgi:hypothetical protein